MRVDNGTTYVLPTLEACCPGCSPNDQSVNLDVLTGENVTSSMETATSRTHAKSSFSFTEDISASFLTLELEQLPLLTEDGDQTPIGARGWYASAVMSAMLLCGHDTLHKDVFRGTNDKNGQKRMIIELGSGVIGLAGMTLAWIIAQHDLQRYGDSDDGLQVDTKIVMTDYDDIVLRQLETNVQETKKRLRQYFGERASRFVPEMEAAHLDWNDYDQDQPLLMQTAELDPDKGSLDENGKEPYSVTFVCGAALVYTEETEACADQVAKILQLHPQAVVWLVQWPREGWFQVFQMQLKQKHQCRIQKFSPVSDIHPHIHELAQQFMPPQIALDPKLIKAIRITSPSKIDE